MTWRNFKFWLMKKLCSEAEWKTLLNIRQGFYDYQREVMRMTQQESINCLSDVKQCQYCDQASENCREEAIGTAVRIMKEIEETRKALKKARKEIKGESLDGFNAAVTIIDEHLREVAS